MISDINFVARADISGGVRLLGLKLGIISNLQVRVLSIFVQHILVIHLLVDSIVEY
jgi:hypothetical protein